MLCSLPFASFCCNFMEKGYNKACVGGGGAEGCVLHPLFYLCVQSHN